MRAISALVFLAVALLLVMAYQAAKQELSIRTSITRLNRARKIVQFNEKEIVDTKVKLDGLNNKLETLKRNGEDMMKQFQEAQKTKENGEKELQTCLQVKEEKVNKKKEMTDLLSKMKETQEAEKAKAQEEVQKLKQQILDRDKAVCAFLDPTHAEGKKLCGM
ncbi:uncharacterized protein si:dkey-87o1.2 [Sardina pilchardus]|uniref:uncharacterized protein si:dkey-87o1.2 n=1 Tax=Sardina pilchardus TaxID=27697 RepID=UPI002E156489